MQDCRLPAALAFLPARHGAVLDRSAIFIGYRRDDTADTVGRIYDKLCERFGRELVYKDVDKTPIGTDFGKHILGFLPRCRVFLAVIGKQWLEVRTPDGRRRIDDPQDWVRIELEHALNTPGLQVVPVLVNDATIPGEDELPESLRMLSRLNAARVRRDPDFHVDMERLVNAIGGDVPVFTGFKNFKFTKRTGLIAAAAAIPVAFVGYSVMKPGPPAPQSGFVQPSNFVPPGGFGVPGADPAIAKVVGDAKWPPSDVAGMAKRATDYVHKKWQADAVLMSISLQAAQADGLDARFTFYSDGQEQQVTLMENMLTSPYAIQDNVGHAISGSFLDLEQAIDAARAKGLNGKKIGKATLGWSSGPACGSGNFAIDNAILPKCPPGRRFVGLQWEIESAVGDRKYVPATGN
jgi:hypothetical protein